MKNIQLNNLQMNMHKEMVCLYNGNPCCPPFHKPHIPALSKHWQKVPCRAANTQMIWLDTEEKQYAHVLLPPHKITCKK